MTYRSVFSGVQQITSKLQVTLAATWTETHRLSDRCVREKPSHLCCLRRKNHTRRQEKVFQIFRSGYINTPYIHLWFTHEDQSQESALSCPLHFLKHLYCHIPLTVSPKTSVSSIISRTFYVHTRNFLHHILVFLFLFPSLVNCSQCFVQCKIRAVSSFGNGTVFLFPLFALSFGTIFFQGTIFPTCKGQRQRLPLEIFFSTEPQLCWF